MPLRLRSRAHPHRNTEVWEIGAIPAILLNPRYTGRQVWNRLRTDEVPVDVDDMALGHENRHRWNNPSDWVWSKGKAHAPVVSVDLFERAQNTSKTRGTAGVRGRRPGAVSAPIPVPRPDHLRTVWAPQCAATR